MRPRTVASLCAALLYLWCEIFQASPFAFLHGGRCRAPQPASGAAATEVAGKPRENLKALFAPVQLAPNED
jgi:hypothetical protein